MSQTFKEFAEKLGEIHSNYTVLTGPEFDEIETALTEAFTIVEHSNALNAYAEQKRQIVNALIVLRPECKQIYLEMLNGR